MTKKSYERPSAQDLLRTTYFLDAMKNFISGKGEKLKNRIPIKMYKIHQQNLETKKNNSSKNITPKLPK